MDFLLNDIWAIGAVLLVLWIINKVLTGRTGVSRLDSPVRSNVITNEKLYQMEHGNFTDEDLKLLLPGQKVLAITLVRKKYGLRLPEALAYVENLQKNESTGSLPDKKTTSPGYIGGAFDADSIPDDKVDQDLER